MFIKKIREWLSPITSQYIGRYYVTYGSPKEGGEPIKFLYFGDYVTRSYLNDLTYDNPPEILVNKVSLFSRLPKLIEQYSPDIVVAHLPARWEHISQKYTNFKTIHNINQAIDVSGSWDKVKSNFGRSRKTFSNQVESKYGLLHRISNDPEDYKKFYKNMYLPYVKRRFNSDYLQLDSYEEMKKYFDRGLLLFVTHKGVDVAGVLCVVDGESLAFRRVGLLDGEQAYNDVKAQMALYYYTIMAAREKGLKYMDAMSSQPFFNDGVYQSKWRWGAELYTQNHSQFVPYYLLLNHSEAVVDFFKNVPTLVEVDKNLFGLLGWDGNAELSAADEKFLRKSYYAKGLKGMILMRYSSSNNQCYYFNDNE